MTPDELEALITRAVSRALAEAGIVAPAGVSREDAR
jgi:hypothetical protein